MLIWNDGAKSFFSSMKMATSGIAIPDLILGLLYSKPIIKSVLDLFAKNVSMSIVVPILNAIDLHFLKGSVFCTANLLLSHFSEVKQ